ncbi:MAG: GNAT family N-acetyltransferase [Pseudomonadota bacterium]
MRSDADPREPSVGSRDPDTNPRIKGWVESNVTYLEMRVRPDRPSVTAPDGVEVRRAVRPTVSFYRYLYHTVGGDWSWSGRRLMDDDTLLSNIRDAAVEVNVLWVEGVPAGLMELDRRKPDEIELLYFGLIPDFIGCGLGRFALDWTVDRAWSFHPSRFWVHTCDLDHPNALAVYQKAGFEIYDRGKEREAILHDMVPPRRQGADIDDKDITPNPGKT